MGLAKYLQHTQTPEWEDAYINYSGLKAQLLVIRALKAPQKALRPFENEDVDHVPRPASNDKENHDHSPGMKNPYLKQRTRISALRWRTSNQVDLPSFSLTLNSFPSRFVGQTSNTLAQQMHAHSPGSRRFPSGIPLSKESKPPTLSPYQAMVSNLPVHYVKFFDMLDAELDKIETFYVEMEEEMQERAKVLRKQFAELGKHCKLFYETPAHLRSRCWTKRAYISVSSMLSSTTRWIRSRIMRPQGSHQVERDGILSSKARRGARGPGDRGPSDDYYKWKSEGGVAMAAQQRLGKVFPLEESDDITVLPQKRANGPGNSSFGVTEHLLQPHEYEHAKGTLRKAVAEHYRGLEALENYRILNLAGFRKVLRKYGKITKIPVLDAYMKEKVETTAFASSTMVSTMLKETEHIFAVRFERSNRRRAISHLRVRPTSKVHHSGTFRTGMWLGLATMAIVGGCYSSFRKQTRDALPSWNILLFVYSIFLLPVFLALLVGTNIFVWMRCRINHVFIFKLNPRSRLDYREYFELPAVLLCTLTCAFWLSLSGIGPPTLWPLVWLLLALLIMFNPICNFMHGQTRWWIIRKIAKLGASGLWTVEFMDLWLGDQFCSLTYSLSNLYFVGCFYAHTVVDHSTTQSVNGTSISGSTFRSLLSLSYDPQEQQAWTTCGVSQNWGWYYALAVTPFLARFLQSLRRYWDSGLSTQLINAGKYGVGIIQSFFYFYWRHHMSPHTGQSYVLFCFASTVNSLYGCAWDFLVDWSMCKPYSRYPLLRPQLVYKSQVLLYYIAMLSNLCIRFIWLIYIYFDKGNIEIYAFIAAVLEMLRRVQWNFYRVENKHLSNMAIHRATRDLPLPYDLQVPSSEEEHAAQLRLRKRIARLS